MKPFQWPVRPVPVVLVGPTAVGKTVVAVELAERLNGEIINADSMQIYRGMDIGTAKPDRKAQERIRFHLLDSVSPDTPFSVSDWKQQAEETLMDITARGKRFIVCGGTGMYIKALLDNWSLATTPADRLYRDTLEVELQELGVAILHSRLQAVDPVTAARLHPNDGIRIVRALEVYHVTGRPISEHQEADKKSRTERVAHRLGLTLPRPELNIRIEQRVEEMIASGLEEEVRHLLQEGYAPTLSPMKSLGYKEMNAYIQGEIEFQTATEQIKQNTRRYAKRQQTWFRADKQIHWFDVSATSSAEIATKLVQYMDTTEATTL